MMQEKTATVQIQLFSVLRELMKTQYIDLSLAGPMTAETLIEALCVQYPAMAEYRGHMVLAVNRVYAKRSDVIEAGDELAIITPVSGG